MSTNLDLSIDDHWRIIDNIHYRNRRMELNINFLDTWLKAWQTMFPLHQRIL